MAVVAGSPGELAILDQVNRRVERYAGGRLVSTIPLGGDSVQDLALLSGGRTVILDRLADRSVAVYGATGKLENEAPIVGGAITEGGATTGVFADSTGIYVEKDHAALIRVADAAGNAGDRAVLPGRPTRDRRLLVSAGIADGAAGTVRVTAWTRATLQPAWTQVVALGAPILTLELLDSDRHGGVYVAAVTGWESPQPPFPILGEGLAIARLDGGGQPRGTIVAPHVSVPEEMFRPVTVDDEGGIYVLEPGAAGLKVVRYTF